MENTSKVSVYKGANTTFELSLRNNDRKSVGLLETDLVKATFVSPDAATTIVFDTIVKNLGLGLYSLTISKEDADNLEVGVYNAHFQIIHQSSPAEILYLDQSYNPFLEVHVEPNRMTGKIPTSTINGDTFTRQILINPENGIEEEIFTSSVLKADRVPYHMMQFSLDKFKGGIEIQISLDMQPSDNDEGWATIREITMINETSDVTTADFIANCLWVRVKYTRRFESTGKITQFLYRN